MNRKVFLYFIVAAVITAATVTAVIGPNSKERAMSDVALENVEALANEDLDCVSCPGGSCTFHDYKWNTGCSACCPEGKSPMCTSMNCRCI